MILFLSLKIHLYPDEWNHHNPFMKSSPVVYHTLLVLKERENKAYILIALVRHITEKKIFFSMAKKERQLVLRTKTRLIWEKPSLAHDRNKSWQPDDVKT